jgi:hypothetical protein
MKNSNHPSGSQTVEDGAVLNTHSAVITLIVFIAVFGAGLAFHYMR